MMWALRIALVCGMFFLITFENSPAEAAQPGGGYCGCNPTTIVAPGVVGHLIFDNCSHRRPPCNFLGCIYTYKTPEGFQMMIARRCTVQIGPPLPDPKPIDPIF